jgi:hypothetical protein
MSPPTTVSAGVDPRQPWLGLASYSEAEAELFFGREKEGFELLRLVRREVLTVLFGPSGTGKTSLLNAGLFPSLRESAFIPISIRLDHTGDRLDYVAQIRARIAEALRADSARPIEEQSLAPEPEQRDQETLWEYLHRVVFWDWRNNPVTPVLVFDQFEEIFTLGRSRAATEKFLTTLADLVENYIPATVRSRLEANGSALAFPHDQPKIKIILSLREDFVWRLDGLRKSMPSVMHNRFLIARMNGEQALQAVREPGQGIVKVPVAQQIVRFVAASDQSRAAEEDEEIRLDSLQVDPALLSVVCRELNARRLREEKAQITAEMLEQAGTNILDDFYELGFSGLTPAVRGFVEDRLLTASGFRSTVPLEELAQAGIADEEIRTLVDRRLIRIEERLDIPHLELTHDLLTRVVQKSRAERQRREQREHERQQREAEERVLAERTERQRAELLRDEEQKRVELQRQQEQETREREKRSHVRTRKAAVGFAALTLIAIAGLSFALHSRYEMQESDSKERAAHAEATKQARIATQAVNRIKQGLLIRQAALSGDQKKLNELLSELVQNNKIQFAATVTDLHYPDRGFEVYKFELFPQQPTLPTGEDKVAFVTYLADSPAFENTLFVAGEKREFRVFYIGWGCLNRIVALTEYAEPTKSPTVTVFDMCKLLGDDWQQSRYRKANSP